MGPITVDTAVMQCGLDCNTDSDLQYSMNKAATLGPSVIQH